MPKAALFFDMSNIKLAVGLGNSPEKYAKTRHNTGRNILNLIAEKCKISFSPNKYCNGQTATLPLFGDNLILLKLEGYMNESGINLKRALSFYKLNISQVAVVYDDTAFDVGRVKISVGGSGGGHNGVGNIISLFGEGFTRIRVGIGAKPYKTMDLADYVLGAFSDADLAKMPAAADTVLEAFSIMKKRGVEFAQNTINQKIHKDEKQQI